MAHVSQFEQGHARGDAEGLFDKWQDPQNDKPDAQPRGGGISAVLQHQLGGSSASKLAAAVAAAIASAVTPPTSISLLRLRISPSRKQHVTAPTNMIRKKAIPSLSAHVASIPSTDATAIAMRAS